MKGLAGGADKAAIRAHSQRLALTKYSDGVYEMHKKATRKLVHLYLKAAYLFFEMHTLVDLYVQFATPFLKIISQIIPIFKQLNTVFVCW